MIPVNNLHGFTWGPATVRRAVEINGSVEIEIATRTGNFVTVTCSPTGRSLRVFDRHGHELTASKITNKPTN